MNPYPTNQDEAGGAGGGVKPSLNRSFKQMSIKTSVSLFHWRWEQEERRWVGSGGWGGDIILEGNFRSQAHAGFFLLLLFYTHTHSLPI